VWVRSLRWFSTTLNSTSSTPPNSGQMASQYTHAQTDRHTQHIHAQNDTKLYLVNTTKLGCCTFFHSPYRWNHTHTHTRLTALCPGQPGWAGTRKVKPIWILLKQETVSGSGISWAICKSAPRSRQTATPAPHHSVFYRPDALPVTQPTVSKHWRQPLEPFEKKWNRFNQIVSRVSWNKHRFAIFA